MKKKTTRKSARKDSVSKSAKKKTTKKETTRSKKVVPKKKSAPSKKKVATKKPPTAKSKAPPKSRANPVNVPVTQQAAGDRHRALMRQKSRDMYRDVRDVGNPPPRDQELWEKYRYDLHGFLVDVFPETTGLKPFSDAHRRVIDSTEHTILKGGRLLRIVFRGFAKSTILENAAIWASGYGHREFFLFIGADQESARQSLDSIQSEFSDNDMLMKIFPAACHCAQALEGHPQRASGQMINGELTHIGWNKQEIVMPTVEGFEGSGCIVRCKGLTGNIRGSRFKRPDGKQVRPDFVGVDDPQTDQSAASSLQCQRRLGILNNTVLQLGGHFKKIACVVNATIIEPDDMIDQLSDRDNYPMWRTDKIPLLKSKSKYHDEEWLGKYADIRTDFDHQDDDDRERAIKDSNDYYVANRKRMDEGAEATWEHCYDEQEISAIQHAYNKLIEDGEDTFEAEYQNAPLRAKSGLTMLTPAEVCKKQFSHKRGEVPDGCDVLTAHIDVHPELLYSHVWGWRPDESGFLIEDITEPDQKRRYFNHSSIKNTLSRKHKAGSLEANIWAGLDAFVPYLAQKKFRRNDGQVMRLDRILIDANGSIRDTIFDYILQSPYGSILYPSFGHYIGVNSKPMDTWAEGKKRGVGPGWVPQKAAPGQPRGYIFDTNFWKTRFHQRLALPHGTPGGLYLYKDRPNNLRRIGDSYNAEDAKRAVGTIREIYEFKPKEGWQNHDFDCSIGAMVAASIEGIGSRRTPKKKTLSLKDIQRKKRNRRAAGARG